MSISWPPVCPAPPAVPHLVFTAAVEAEQAEADEHEERADAQERVVDRLDDPQRFHQVDDLLGSRVTHHRSLATQNRSLSNRRVFLATGELA